METSTPAKSPPASLLVLEQLMPILAHVRAMVGGPIRFLEMRVDADSFDIQIQDSDALEKIDSYQMRAGEELRKVPIDRPGATAAAISKATISLDEVHLGALPGLLQQVQKKGVELDGAGKPTLYIARNAKGDPQMLVSLPAAGKAVDLKADLQGEVLLLEVR